MYVHLLVPIDGSELSDHAVTQSVALAGKLQARITGFVVEPMPPLPTEGGGGLSSYMRKTEEHQARTEVHAHETLARFEARALAQGVPFQGVFKRSDAVDHAIVAAAEEHGCDLVVMATHGRGFLGNLVFGSHTKNIISSSKLPVLVLH